MLYIELNGITLNVWSTEPENGKSAGLRRSFAISYLLLEPTCCVIATAPDRTDDSAGRPAQNHCVLNSLKADGQAGK
jgi:hypothetical protein